MKKLTLAVYLLLAGCTFAYDVPPPIDYTSLTKDLTVGMSKEEVVKILGQPKSKSFSGKKEIYQFYSKGEDNTPDIINYTILLPLNMFGGTPVINKKVRTSSLKVYFDEKGRLEKF